VKSKTRSLALQLLLASALLARGASADPALQTRAIGVSWSGQTARLSFNAADFVDAKVAEKLGSGLPQRLVMRVYAYPEGGEVPIAAAALSCRVVYDLWEGVYRVQAQSDTSDRSFTLADRGAVVRACLDVRGLALGELDTFSHQRNKRVYFAVLIELNPLSPDTVQRIRRWLNKSGGSQIRGDAFFGSFVSIFVSRKLGSAEHSLAFRSAAVSVPP
jgi:hypothetical protein